MGPATTGARINQGYQINAWFPTWLSSTSHQNQIDRPHCYHLRQTTPPPKQQHDPHMTHM